MLAVVRRLWSRFLRISHRRDKTCFFFKNYAYFDEEVGEEVPSILWYCLLLLCLSNMILLMTVPCTFLFAGTFLFCVV